MALNPFIQGGVWTCGFWLAAAQWVMRVVIKVAPCLSALRWHNANEDLRSPLWEYSVVELYLHEDVD